MQGLKAKPKIKKSPNKLNLEQFMAEIDRKKSQ